MRRKTLLLAAASAALVLATTTTAFGVGASPLKATGTIGYHLVTPTLDRTLRFTVHDRDDACTYAFVNGTYGVDVVYLGVHYAEVLDLEQWGSAIVDGSIELAGGGSHFDISSGSVKGAAVSFTGSFGGTTVRWTGTIAADGSMAGTWTDLYVLSPRTGTWATTSGHAAVTAGCTGSNLMQYVDANGDTYAVNVTLWRFDGSLARFGGPVVWADGGVDVGTWIVVQVVDNGEPGIGADTLAATTVPAGGGAAAAAAALVAGSSALIYGPVSIDAGNLQVH